MAIDLCILYYKSVDIIIRKYGSTFYIGIAMVVLPYIGPWENLNFSFHFQFPLNLISTNTKVENMLKANDIWKKSRKPCKIGVIHVISIFTELPCSSSSSSASSASSSSG